MKQKNSREIIIEHIKYLEEQAILDDNEIYCEIEIEKYKKILYDLNRFEAVKNILWNENLTLGDKMKEIRKSIEVEDYYKYFIDRE